MHKSPSFIHPIKPHAGASQFHHKLSQSPALNFQKTLKIFQALLNSMASKAALTSTALLLISTLLISLIPSSSATCPLTVDAMVSACVHLGLFTATTNCCDLFSVCAEADVGTCLCSLIGLGKVSVGVDVCLSLLKNCPNVKVPASVTCY